MKVLGIEAGVNIAVGLPVNRTSVGHGTAFDMTGKVPPPHAGGGAAALALAGKHPKRL